MSLTSRILFPVLFTVAAALPLARGLWLQASAGITYLVFSFVSMLLVIQCAQASRSRGLRPTLTLSVCYGIANALQCAGFLASALAGSAASSASAGTSAGVSVAAAVAGTTAAGPGLGQIGFISIVSLWLLGIVAVLMWHAGRGTTSRDLSREADVVELLGQRKGAAGRDMTKTGSRKPAGASTPSYAAANPQGRGGEPDDKTAAKREQHDREADARAGQTPAYEAPGHVRDRLSKQCAAVQAEYGLSTRETEVAELLVRGNSVARIAELLYISENTVRTHTKRIYDKLDIHKKAELIACVEGALEQVAERGFRGKGVE